MTETTLVSRTNIPSGTGSPIENMARNRFAPYKPAVFTVINLSIFFALWQVLALSGVVNPLFFPTATDLFSALFTGMADGTILPQLQHSLTNFLIVAAAVGIPVGLLMGSSRIVDLILSPYVWAMSSLPRVALIPLLILVLGFGNEMQLTIIILSAVFPIIINCMEGVKTVDPSLVRAGQVFGANRFQMYGKIIVPYTLPFVISGINQGIARGLVGMLIGELLGGGGSGLGFLLDRAADRFDAPMLYATLILLAVMSVSLVQSIRWVERRVAPWRDRAGR
jgi:ABC-type nitrate/sulfonate/bicarbonate transport system permease component